MSRAKYEVAINNQISPVTFFVNDSHYVLAHLTQF